MADSAPNGDSSGDHGDNSGVTPGPGSYSATPRWVKLFGIIAIVVLVVFVILLLTGGPHGPGRHTGGLAPAAATFKGAGGAAGLGSTSWR